MKNLPITPFISKYLIYKRSGRKKKILKFQFHISKIMPALHCSKLPWIIYITNIKNTGRFNTGYHELVRCLLHTDYSFI